MQSFAQAGATGLSFLKIGVGGRNVGMGDVGVVDAQDGSTIHYNPATMLTDNKSSIMVMHNEWVQDLTTEYLGVVLPYESWSMGFHLNMTNVGNIELRQVPGEADGTTSARFMSLGLSLAVNIINNLNVGFTTKYLFQKIFVDQAGGYAFDFGARYQTSIDGLAAGVAVSNVGSMQALRNEPTKLPSLMRAGVAYKIPIKQIESSVTIEANTYTVFLEKKYYPHIGVEGNYQDKLFVRAGYQIGYDDKGFSAGLGIAFSPVRFDYGFTPFSSSFGNSHTVSLTVQF